jgi:hypothetical protein
VLVGNVGQEAGKPATTARKEQERHTKVALEVGAGKGRKVGEGWALSYADSHLKLGTGCMCIQLAPTIIESLKETWTRQVGDLVIIEGFASGPAGRVRQPTAGLAGCGAVPPRTANTWGLAPVAWAAPV